jgi:DNA polymerase-3 subunit delta
MIIKFYDLKKKFNKNTNFYLFYGQNAGLIDETINNTIIPNSSKNVNYYEEIEVINNIDVFKEEILNRSFFEDSKLIMISRVTDKILPIIEEIIEKNINDVKILLRTVVLDKKSKLRNFFEKNSKTIIVPFYEDNNQTLSILAQNFFKEKKINISSENINLIINRSKGDRLNLKNELEKIFNFARDKKSISSEEIIKLTNLAENYDVSELIDQCLSKNKKKTINILNENNLSSEDNILILKIFLFKLKRLKKLKETMIAEKNIEKVLSSYKPPIFWKDKDFIKKQLQNWSLDQINSLLKDINQLEILIKKNSQISNLITNNFILDKVETN